jgi:DNA-binding NarL/FixJ family response regulator
MEALYQSIDICLYIGAVAHEDAGLACTMMTDESQPSNPPEALECQDGAHCSEITEREKQVLNGVAHAQSNRVIAHQLGVKETTVKSHLRKIFRKLGATSRVDAINKAGLYQGPWLIEDDSGVH